MNKRPIIISTVLRPKRAVNGPPGVLLQKRATLPVLWLWPAIAIVVGLLTMIMVSIFAGVWLKHMQLPVSQASRVTSPAITTLAVERTSPYAGLTMTVINVQYATTFVDDDIHPVQALVRLNMQITNATTAPIKLLYYDIARLLIPQRSPVAPITVKLSVGPKPGTSETGWIDFPVSQGVQLDALALQVGSATLHELLVTIPFKGSFDPHRYASKTSPQHLDISYNFLGHMLVYHLIGVERDFSYQGNQCKQGQQFYVLNFLVDNANAVDVTPGYAFDYVRLVLDSNTPPAAGTLSNSFKAGAKGIGGQVVFAAFANLATLTIGFLPQTGAAQQNYSVTL